MASANIFQQYLQAPKSVLDYSNDFERADALKNQNALQAMTVQQQQAATAQSLQERNALQRVAASSGGSRDALITGLRNSGLPGLMTQADTLEQGGAKLTETNSIAAKNNAEAAKTNQGVSFDKRDKALTDIAALETPDQAIASLNAHHAAGDIDDIKYQAVLSTLAPALRDPSQFPKWQVGMLKGILTPKDNLTVSAPSVQMEKAGDRLVPVQTNAYAPGGISSTVPGLTPIPIGQSADNVATTGLGYSKLNEEKRHNGVTEGLENTKVQQAGGANGKMTEDQGKATGWLVQAENAFGNMKSAMSSTPSAARPGINDIVAGIPGMGGIANSMRSADRQKFMQGSSSLSEALLRAATGAGVNKDEAAQKIQELTPVFGEDPETTQQKMDAIPLYIESLKVRAGPGAPKAAAVLATKAKPAAASGGWKVEEVK